MEPIGGIELDLSLGPQNSGVVQKAPLKFECVLTKDGWDDVSFWLQPFCETETGSFQWLNEDGETSLLLSREQVVNHSLRSRDNRTVVAGLGFTLTLIDPGRGLAALNE